MGPLTMILGSPIQGDGTPGKVRLVTPAGDVLSIQEEHVIHSGNVDSGGDLKRYAIPADAIVTIETTGAALRGLNFASESVLKRLAPHLNKHDSDPPGLT